MLNCSNSNKVAEPEPTVVLTIANSCFVGRGDDGGDDDFDDNDDELLIFTVAGFNCCVWLLKPVFCSSFFFDSRYWFDRR